MEIEQIKNLEKDKLTINIVWANVFGILIVIPVTIIYGLPYYFLWGNVNSMEKFKTILRGLTPELFFLTIMKILLIMVAGIIIHELIHGVVWAKYSKYGFKSIKFGVFWKMLTPYCHCKERLNVGQYVIGAIMPALILGFIPATISIIIGNLWLLIFGIFFTIAACGDFLVINLLRKEKMNSFVQDHPSEAGCYIYRKKNQLTY